MSIFEDVDISKADFFSKITCLCNFIDNDRDKGRYFLHTDPSVELKNERKRNKSLERRSCRPTS